MFSHAPMHMSHGSERATRLEDLEQHAYIDTSQRDNYEVMWWIEEVGRYYEEGDKAYHCRRLDAAYVNYMRGLSIMAAVKGHIDYLEIETHPFYLRLKQRTQDDVGARLKAVAHELQRASGQHHLNQAEIVRLPPPNPSTASYGLKVEPRELAKWLTAEKKIKSVLLLDIRSRDDFEYACIKHQWILQIEPTALRQDTSPESVEEAMAYNPQAEQTMYVRRREFDIIVYYDQNSRFPNRVNRSLIYLHAVLCFGRPTSRPPLMLEGGFDAWQDMIGEKGVFHFPQVKRKPFIDNPFNGFTATSSQDYDRPPPMVNTVTPYPPRPKPSPSISEPRHLLRHSSTAPPSQYPASPKPPSPQWTQMSSDVQAGVTGLKNLGNTCYINSIIQCLSGTTPLARYFISGTYRKDLNRQNNLGSGGKLADSFAKLLQVMWKQEYNFVSPMTFRDELAVASTQFAESDQQDSQEFLNFLLDKLHEDTNLAPKNRRPEQTIHENMPDWEASSKAWDNFLARNDSRIVHWLHGQYRSRLTCLKCSTTSTTYNSFMSLSLPIRDKKYRSVTLDDCLQRFVKQETLEKSDAWDCPTCKKPRRAIKQLTLSRLPDILLIHLKRFDGPFRKKLETTVQCPTKNLDLSAFIDDSYFAPDQENRPLFKYDLYAVSNHEGSLLSGGHYTACVRKGHRGNWLHFDDTQIREMDEHKVAKIVSREAYNLFYVRSTVQ